MIITRPSFRWITVGIWLMPLTFAATAVCLLGAFWRELLLRWQSREIGWLPRTPVGWGWWLLMGLGGVSTALSDHPALSVFSWLGGLGYAITFVVATWTVNTPGRLKQLHKALFGLATAMAAFGLVVWWCDFHYLWHHRSGMEIKIGFDGNRINSVMYHPNLLAGFLVLALGCGLGLFHQVADGARKLAYGVGLAAVALCLFLTASRAGWIGGAILLVGFGASVDRRWLVALVAGAGVAFAAFPDMIVSRLASLSASSPAFDQNRVLVWKSAKEMITQRPWFGWGPGSWEWAYPHFRSLMETEGLPHAHNYYLHVASEFGVPVVVTLMAIVAFVCWTGVRDTRHTQYHHPVLATVAAVVGYLAVNMFDYTLSEGRNAMAFFLMLGGVEAARRMAMADRPPELRRTVPAASSPVLDAPDDPVA